MQLKIILCFLAILGTFVTADEAKATEMKQAVEAEMAVLDDMKSSAKDDEKMMQIKSEEKHDTPVHTVGDFIIHPLVAFRARQTSQEDTPIGRQSETSSTTAAPWPVIGLGYGQVIGSQVSNLAGQISGWLNDRIQLPGLLDPLAQQNTTTTTTTPRPDVIVRVQHRPAISINAKPPTQLISNNLGTQNVDYEQDENDFGEEEEEEYEGEGFEDEEEEEEDEIVKPVGQRRPNRRQQLRPQRIQQFQQLQPNRRPVNRRRPQFNRYDDYAEDDSDDEFYYGEHGPAQQQNNFAQLEQQNLINQILLLTRGKTPAQIGDALRKTNPERQHGTFLVKKNGQTVFLAPELLEEEENSNDPFHVLAQSLNSAQAGQFPAPPLSKPLKKDGKIQQYITIPYNQLGIAPPQVASGIAEGIQSQPLILSIPHSALQKLQSGEKQDRPLITPNAVPLLSEVNLADLFKPPQKTKPQNSDLRPVYVYTPSGNIRPHTNVDKAPSSLNIKQVKTEEAYIILNDDEEESGRQASKSADVNSRFYKFPKGGRFAIRNARTLDQSHSPAKEEFIPVQIVEEKLEPIVAAEQLNNDEVIKPDEIKFIEGVPAEAPAIEINPMTESKNIEKAEIAQKSEPETQEKKEEEPKL